MRIRLLVFTLALLFLAALHGPAQAASYDLTFGGAYAALGEACAYMYEWYDGDPGWLSRAITMDQEELTKIDADRLIFQRVIGNLRDVDGVDGAVDKVLVGYNAGPRRVDRWTSQRPGLPEEEFIETIPFTETRFYVRIVLANREEYRRLYGIGPNASEPANGGAP